MSHLLHLLHIPSGKPLSNNERAHARLHDKVFQALPPESTFIDLALSSDFRDVEDAFQYFTAIENHIPVLITRNLRDYKTATISVMTAEQFLKSKTSR